MLNFLEGADHCLLNSIRLQTTADIITRDEVGTDSFALFLYYMAYEEIAKGVFCLFVHKEYVSDEFVQSVFERHHPKIALFEEILRGFAFYDGNVFLGDRRLGDTQLDDFVSSHLDTIREHRRKTMNFIYVDKDANTWKVPSVRTPDFENQKKQILCKINLLRSIFEFIKNHIDNINTQADNFKFYEDENGGFVMRFDQI